MAAGAVALSVAVLAQPIVAAAGAVTLAVAVLAQPIVLVLPRQVQETAVLVAACSCCNMCGPRDLALHTCYKSIKSILLDV